MRVEEDSCNRGGEEVRKSHQIGSELNQYLTHCRRSRSSSFSSTTTANNSSDSTFPSMWDNWTNYTWKMNANFVLILGLIACFNNVFLFALALLLLTLIRIKSLYYTSTSSRRVGEGRRKKGERARRYDQQLMKFTSSGSKGGETRLSCQN